MLDFHKNVMNTKYNVKALIIALCYKINCTYWYANKLIFGCLVPK